jgi:hypothetical protein
VHTHEQHDWLVRHGCLPATGDLDGQAGGLQVEHADDQQAAEAARYGRCHNEPYAAPPDVPSERARQPRPRSHQAGRGLVKQRRRDGRPAPAGGMPGQAANPKSRPVSLAGIALRSARFSRSWTAVLAYMPAWRDVAVPKAPPARSQGADADCCEAGHPAWIVASSSDLSARRSGASCLVVQGVEVEGGGSGGAEQGDAGAEGEGA